MTDDSPPPDARGPRYFDPSLDASDAWPPPRPSDESSAGVEIEDAAPDADDEEKRT